MPASEFERRRVRVAEIVDALSLTFEKLQHKTAIDIILTVSPVRHLRDGLVENQRSKATLLLAAEELSKNLSYVHYFPSYEIVLDDLRDYRFYEADMAHPNQQATAYIWQYFEEAFFEEKTKRLCRRIEQIVSAANHRPFHPQSPEHQAFLRTQLDIVEKMEDEFPSIDFSAEKKIFSAIYHQFIQ
jgi:hypothetical protein